jgi:hypothetical protein
VKSRLVLSLGLSIGAVGVEPGVNGSIVIHTYRWWLGRAEGEPHYDELEKRLATGPVIAVPTMTLEGDANGAPHPDASA